MSRISKTQYFMMMAHTAALRGTCSRRKVGCILVDSMGHVLATGYNGPPRGISHCIDDPCLGANSKSGEGLDLCQAIHAEQNALLQCPDVGKIAVCYCTAKPCTHCIKLLANTGCKLIYYAEDYPSPLADKLWEDIGGRMVKYEMEEHIL